MLNEEEVDTNTWRNRLIIDADKGTFQPTVLCHNLHFVSDILDRITNMAEDAGSPLSEASDVLNNLVDAAKEAITNNGTGTCFGGGDRDLDVLGLVAIIVFYLAVLAVSVSSAESSWQTSNLGWSLGKLENTQGGAKSGAGKVQLNRHLICIL